MSHVLEIENLGKLYRLGLVTHKTLNEDVKRFIYKLKGKGDPFAKVGAVNDRTRKTKEDYVWALRNLSFNVEQGDIIGIIGKNGAGKSTLLKLLSRITAPTEGEIRIKGRVASLLEVGTGFHSELTGRENIYLNGAILGMNKQEIKSKLDEIIHFSGVDNYVDTPVKRYSSGMLVRLGFAVAAHLEPEILIVDEVLAVGDIEFQKKCIGKMQEVGAEGRTILFVSHNMSSVRNLCRNGIVLSNGQFAFQSDADAAVDFYLDEQKSKSELHKSWENPQEAPGNESVKLLSYDVNNHNTNYIHQGQDIIINLKFLINKLSSPRLDVSIEVKDESGTICFLIGTHTLEEGLSIEKGYLNVEFDIKNNLNIGLYSLTVRVIENMASNAICRLDDIIIFEVIADPEEVENFVKTRGVIVPSYKIKK